MIFTGTGITAMGLLLVITTPNHPGALVDPALHPAVHWLLGGFGIIVGLAMVLTDVLFGHQPSTPTAADPSPRVQDASRPVGLVVAV